MDKLEITMGKKQFVRNVKLFLAVIVILTMTIIIVFLKKQNMNLISLGTVDYLNRTESIINIVSDLTISFFIIVDTILILIVFLMFYRFIAKEAIFKIDNQGIEVTGLFSKGKYYWSDFSYYRLIKYRENPFIVLSFKNNLRVIEEASFLKRNLYKKNISLIGGPVVIGGGLIGDNFCEVAENIAMRVRSYN
ncbi:MAG: hypothetical protein ACRDD2_12665 [Sarcina sp.]